MALKPGPPPEVELLPHTPTRLAIGSRTQKSTREAPQFWLTSMVDAAVIVAAHQRFKQQSEPAPSYNDFIIKAVADVIGQHPRFNCWYTPEGLQLLKQVNIAFAVATDAGVLMPTVFDADKKSLVEIATDTVELAALARSGKLRASLQRNAGFSISNIGRSTVGWFNAIISEPQPGILAIGSLAPRPMVIDGQVVARSTLHLTLTVDHRCADGAEGAAFLDDIVGRLQDPEAW